MGLDAMRIESQLVARQEARTQKDWAESDRIRDTLAQLGVVVMDTSEGVSWKLSL
jgi:cysteinyl-tRNA synthetase